MRLFAIDPGETESAWVDFDTREKGVLGFATEANADLRRRIIESHIQYDVAAIEIVTGYGKAVGVETFTTCEWIGRFSEQIEGCWPATKLDRLPRREVKRILCEEVGAGDSHVKAAVIAYLGGKETVVGRKKAPGPLYTMKGDEWQALGVALAWVERRRWELELEQKTRAFSPAQEDR